MSRNFKIAIMPIKNYSKYATQKYTLCLIKFDFFFDGNNHSLCYECNDKCLQEIMLAADDYFNEKNEDAELYFEIPWIFCGVYYPYSFAINVREKQWKLRFKKNYEGYCSDFDVVYTMSDGDVRYMRAQIESEYNKIEWESLGKSELFQFNLPKKDFEWCYSAKAFNDALNEICMGKKIDAIYVSATNYADPLKVENDYVNYYIGSEMFVVLDDVILNLLIFAYGLFKWRSFDISEVSIMGPRVDFIRDGDSEFCNIHNVYNAFKLDYRNSKIDEVIVQDTDDFPWEACGFDESKLGNPIELPEEVFLKFENGNILSLVGYDDDFAIRIKNANE